MPDNTNVNNNAAVVVVGRTAPVPPGQQKSEKSIPVVIASDQTTIPVAEQNKVQSEVALSLLGIPRSEVALGIFADVNTYDVNPSEWSSSPEQFSSVANTGVYVGVAQTMGWGLTHVPEESGALVESPADKTAVLTSKRFFRYQPGRVSAATFGVKTTLIGDDGVDVFNPVVRKYGIFDNYDGYYWESRNDGTGDNFSVVRRTQSLIYSNPLTFGNGSGQQSQDYGNTNPPDQFTARVSESAGITTVTAKKFGNLVILRDNLVMTHAGVYDPSLLQNESQVAITSITSGNVVSLVGLAKSVSNAVYDNTTGIMVVTTNQPHGFEEGKYIKISGIRMTCAFGSNVYPDPGRNSGYNIISVGGTNTFTLNVGIATVPTTYQSGGYILGLSEGQYVSYSKGTNASVLTGFDDTKIYKVSTVGVSTLTGISTVKLINLDGSSPTFSVVSGISSHVLVTPVPFVQPTSGALIGSYNKYQTVKPTGMFPYMYNDGDGNKEGYIDSSIQSGASSTLKGQIDDVNNYYGKWVNQNVKKDYWNVYEYRVPRSRFSGDNLNAELGNPLYYSDAVGDKRAGQAVVDPDTNEELTDDSIWNLDLTKVTMYKIEFSWYGAVGALFLAYVPVSNGEARWVRVHHLRASNQLKVSSLGNATLPITYLIYGGGNPNRFGYANSLRSQSPFAYGSSSEHIIKYGASYYIDGGDRGTVKLYSYSTPVSQQVYGSKRSYTVSNGTGTNVSSTQVDLTNATSATDPYIIGSVGMSTSYYVGSKVVTSEALDQNIEITFVNVGSQKLYLNAPLSITTPSTFTVIPNRTTPLIGLKCRESIQSSTGKSVRNRTQVYPTRLSSGSTGVVKLDLVKSPIFQTTYSTTGTLSLSSSVNIGKRGKPTSVSVTNASYLSANTGVYGYMRGYYENDSTKKPISILGYLENRGTVDGYYFYALKSTSDNVVLYDNPNSSPTTFLKEENHNPVGTIISGTNTEFTLATLSSVKVNPQSRSPIPNTGTVITSIFIPASGQEFDLSSYFDYNKEYLSFPLTNKIESLYLCASSQTTYNSGTPAADVSTSLTWEEQ
jgi:hypothetical protein